ncbi:MAG: DEAD/DEAH box helicase [Pseudomonadota bacterium]
MLKRFHPTISQWFADTYAQPTEVQLASWPVIADKCNALITAPTGSGKTLTAFLWALSEFAQRFEHDGNSPANTTRVLYISPLKALNNDIRRNLFDPLQVLQERYNFPNLKVETRSGDTPQNERQKLLRSPPDILITTPESLGLMLTTVKGRMALGHVDTVILDEIHAIVGNRRGVALMAQLERLQDICGGFQRIALSATVKPLDKVAAYVAGRDSKGDPRPIEVINTPGEKKVQFNVRFPEAAKQAADQGKKIWDPLSESFREVIGANDSTLFFTNSRRLAEKITLKINENQIAPVAYAHHGSLAREVRTEVEARLKQGELAAIVATNSLELGIDVGHLDEVVMVQSPPSVASALQRIGRAGHSVGETSVGTLFPTHAHDFLEAAALSKAITEKNLEPQTLMSNCLDVLAQFIISTTASEPWPVEDLYQLVSRAEPYATLQRDQFDLVIEMLTGRYAGSRIRELKPRLEHDKIANTVKANKGALFALYNSGGTIPDRGYFQMRHKDTGAILGELDEEFVWEATVGDNLTLGTAHWQIHRITHNDVLVRPAKPGSAAPPFWRSEFFNRSFHYSEQIANYLREAEDKLSNQANALLVDSLTQQRGFEETAAEELVGYLDRQRTHTQTALPHRKHLLLEKVKTGPAGYRGPDDPQQLVIHTFWGGQLNHPWALALRAAWRFEHGQKLDIHADNNALVLQIKGDLDPHKIMSMVTADNLLNHLRASLEGSGFFGARFRECAGRSLLLTKQKFNQRLPLWMSRMQAKKLMTQVKALTDFPVLLETWRTCLDDEFNIPALLGMLEELHSGELEWSYVSSTTPSPFSHNLTFGQVSRYMYADDTPTDDSMSVLGSDAINAALTNDLLRPRLEPAIVQEFVKKRQRTAQGYAPEGAQEWEAWLKERVLIPQQEWPTEIQLPDKACQVQAQGRIWITHIELAHALYRAGLLREAPPLGLPELPDPRDGLSFAQEVLSFYGPLTAAEIEDILPVVPEGLWTNSEAFVVGPLLADSDDHYWCDTENFEILLRFQRASRRTQFDPQPVADLPTYWASLSQLHSAGTEENVLWSLENLRGFGAAAEVWLEDLMHSRVEHTSFDQWRAILEANGFIWRGCGKEQITIFYPEEQDLIGTDQPPILSTLAFPDPNASYTFNQVANTLDTSSQALNEQWWGAVWAGQLVCHDLAHLRKANQRNYNLTHLQSRVSNRRRLARAPLSWPGQWQLVSISGPSDPLTQLENDKERVRLLLDRYGFVNRDIVNREQWQSDQGIWKWRDAFRALRIMELAGEVFTGCFFNAMSTPQFISPRALSTLQANRNRVHTFWINATDPVSPCGLGTEVRQAWPELPHRRPTNYLSFRDGKLALIVENNGAQLKYSCSHDDPAMAQINAPLHHLVHHKRVTVTIKSINGEEARTSPYLAPLQDQFNLYKDHKSVSIEPGF